ncbi:ribosome biogenesis protein SLX9 homolog [Denticeps clupeoides]|uniref:Protein FAM207A n=1 Tax=Denticeps clupeoides TaxID=299321 RepID=A0A8C4A3B9_9TELE|nr:protein FAM207A [Denticeps clupeoides]
MVGKIKRGRQKLHQVAVKLNVAAEERSSLERLPVPAVGAPFQIPAAAQQQAARAEPLKQVQSSFPVGIFAGTEITPESLIQTLKFEEQKNPVQADTTGTREKKQQSKKEKMKERRERWLNKISSIKIAKEQQAAQARRKATPVVGDMRPLADALPELSKLIPASSASTHRKAQVPKKRTEPFDFCLMKPVQKRKFLESERSRFSEAMKNPAFKSNPLAAIGEHLRKRLKQEEEEKSPS